MKKRLTNQEIPNSGVISIKLDPESYSKLMKNAFTALRKFSSNKKTRSVHKLLTAGVVYPAIFSGNGSDYLVMSNVKNNTLRLMNFNLKMFDDSLSQAGAVGFASKIQDFDTQIQKEKTFLGEKQVYNIEQLNEDKDEVIDKFLKSIDYIKLVDGIYFGWLSVLSDSIVTKEGDKSKVLMSAATILSDVIKKMYSKMSTGRKMDSEVHQLIEAIAIYFMRIYYYGETAQYALNLMKKGFPEETLEVIKRTGVTQFKEFNDLTLILNATQLMPITKTTFDLEMQRMFGKYAYEMYIQMSLASFIAFMANLANPSQIFKDAYEMDDESHKRLERLILDEQKNIKIESKDI